MLTVFMIISKYALMGRAMHTRDSHQSFARAFSVSIQFIYFSRILQLSVFPLQHSQRKTTKTESSDFQVLESYDNNIDRANIKIIYKLQNGQEEG